MQRDCRIDRTNPSCYSPKALVLREGPSSRLEISLRHSWKRFNSGKKMFATTNEIPADAESWRMDCVLLECVGDVCSVSVSLHLWSWRSPETRANFIGHVESWKQIWEIMGRHIDEELWSFSESRPASHLAWQVVAGVVELEWSQQKSWNQPSFRWVCHLQQCWSDHVLFLWAWGCVDLGPQKRSSDKDVVPRRRWRFGGCKQWCRDSRSRMAHL